jgi:hypothetical protein
MSEITIEFYTDNAGEWRWRLVASNGEIFESSHEGFASRESAERNLRLVQTSDDPSASTATEGETA